MTDSEQLTTLLRERFDALNELGTVAISTGLLASEVYAVIDAGGIAPSLVKVAATLELKQLARSICRQRQEQAERVDDQASLFDVQLQPRYPATRDGDDAYILREHLTVQERFHNIARLTKEATAKQLHADALKAETEDLMRQGKLTEVTA